MTVGSAKRGVLGLVAWVLWSMLVGVGLAQGLPDEVRADQYFLAAKTALAERDPRRAIAALEKYAGVVTEREWEFLYIYGTLLVEYGDTEGEIKKGQKLLGELVQKRHEGKEDYEKKYYDEGLKMYSVAEKKLETSAEEAGQIEALRAGRNFRDCDICPEMVVVPAGSFMMGSLASEAGRDNDEGPVHRVTFEQPFAVGKYEVTFAEWDACVTEGGCDHYPDDKGWGRESRPVIDVSWDDAQAYVRWLSEKTGEAYRLLSEAEWEYVARAGTRTRYFWGNTIGWGRANCVRCGSRYKQTAPVGRFRANAFGLHDVHGNVWEWTQDCWNDNYRGAPADGGAWERGDCDKRVLRGGSWRNSPSYLRSAFRGRNTVGIRSISFNGFRLARTLTP